MPRNDSLLDTGMSSALDRRIAEKKNREERAKQDVRQKLTPGAEIILDWIKQEEDDVVNLKKMILDVTNQERLLAQLYARQLHLQFLENLRNKAKIVLREVKTEDRKRRAAK